MRVQWRTWCWENIWYSRSGKLYPGSLHLHLNFFEHKGSHTYRISLTSPSLHPPNWFSCMLFLHNTMQWPVIPLYIPMILYSDIFMLVIPYTNDNSPVISLYQSCICYTSIPILMIPLLSLYHALYTIICYTYNTIPLYTSDIPLLPQYQWYLYNLCIVPQLPVCCLQGISAPHHHAPHNITQSITDSWSSFAYIYFAGVFTLSP